VAGAPRADSTSSAASAGPSGLVAGSFTSDAGTLTYRGYRSRHSRRHPPLFVMLHGAMQSAAEFASITHMNDVADEFGAIVLYPEQSTLAHPFVCWNWYDRAHQLADGGEPSLIAGATRQFAALHDASLRQVFVAGMSAGGAMAVLLGEAYPELFAAVGVHSGLPAGAANDSRSARRAMSTGPTVTRDTAGGTRRAVRTIVFHGDCDTTVHPANGHAILEQVCSRQAVASAAALLSSERIRMRSGRQVTRVTRTGDRGSALAELWIVHGGAHEWSGGGASGTDSCPDASREMARFFLEPSGSVAELRQARAPAVH